MNCLLADWQIRKSVNEGHLVINPFSGSVEPASYDLRMGNRVISLTRGFDKTLRSDEKVTIHPGELILIESFEKVGFPLDLQGRICSKVSWLRKGLSSIATKVDPGYGYPDGWHLLLVFNHCGHEPLELSPESPICSLEIEKLDKKAKKPYSGDEPKTILLRPVEVVDPLSQVKEFDFTKLKKNELERFYGHPLDDLFLAIGALQENVDEFKNRLPRPRPFWKSVILIYCLYFLGCTLLSYHLHTLFPSIIETKLLLTVYGIIAGAIGAILGAYSRKKGNNEVSN